LHADGPTRRLAGEILGELTDTGDPIILPRWLRSDSGSTRLAAGTVILTGTQLDVPPHSVARPDVKRENSVPDRNSTSPASRDLRNFPEFFQRMANLALGATIHGRGSD